MLISSTLFNTYIVVGIGLSMHPVKEYSDLLNLIEQDSTTREDVYQELIKKEEKVLDVVSRVSSQMLEKNNNDNSLLDMSISEATARFANTWKNIYVEMIESRSVDPRKIADIVTKDDRKVYVGFMLVMIAMFLYFISVSHM